MTYNGQIRFDSLIDSECYCGHAPLDHRIFDYGDCDQCECMGYMHREVNGVPASEAARGKE